MFFHQLNNPVKSSLWLLFVVFFVSSMSSLAQAQNKILTGSHRVSLEISSYKSKGEMKNSTSSSPQAYLGTDTESSSTEFVETFYLNSFLLLSTARIVSETDSDTDLGFSSDRVDFSKDTRDTDLDRITLGFYFGRVNYLEGFGRKIVLKRSVSDFEMDLMGEVATEDIDTVEFSIEQGEGSGWVWGASLEEETSESGEGFSYGFSISKGLGKATMLQVDYTSGRQEAAGEKTDSSYSDTGWIFARALGDSLVLEISYLSFKQEYENDDAIDSSGYKLGLLYGF